MLEIIVSTGVSVSKLVVCLKILVMRMWKEQYLSSFGS